MSSSYDKGFVNVIKIKKRKSVPSRLGDEELPWDAVWSKAEVTAFQPMIWSWIKGLDFVSGAAPTRKQFCIWVRWWK